MQKKIPIRTRTAVIGIHSAARRVALALWMAFLIEEPSLCRAVMIPDPYERVYSPVPRASSHPNLSSRYIYSEKLVVALTTQTRSKVRLNLETLHRGDILLWSPG